MRAAVTLALLSVGVAVASCTVPAKQGAVWGGPRNDCSNCAGDARTCINGACRINAVSYPLVLEVIPAPTALYGAGLTFAIPITSKDGGDRPPDTLHAVRLTFSLDASTVLDLAKPIPLEVRLTQLQVPAGSVAQTYSARGSSRDSAPGKGSLHLDVPAGHYAVYATTFDTAIVSRLPPILLDDLDLSSGQAAFAVAPTVVADLKSLDLTILDETGTAPLDQAADGYDVAIYDRGTGDRVSTIDNTCTHPGGAHIVLSPHPTKHTYVVRFTPPTKPCDSTPVPLRPRYDFDFDALNVGGGLASVGVPRVATLRALQGKPDAAPVAISISGTLTSPASSSQLTSTLLFRSRKLTVPVTWKTGTAFFEARTDTTSKGAYSVAQLISGTYDVQIVPGTALNPSNQYAVTTVERQTITLDHQVLDLAVQQPMEVSGSVISEANELFTIGLVTFNAGATTTMSGTSLFALAPIARNADSGEFKLKLDPGPYHMVMRVPSISGYPWVVRPRIDVGTKTATSGQVPLGPVTVRPPVVFHGAIVTPAGDVVANAAIRARAGITDGSTIIDTVIVGETTTGDDGSFTLLVPAGFEPLGTAAK